MDHPTPEARDAAATLRRMATEMHRIADRLDPPADPTPDPIDPERADPTLFGFTMPELVVRLAEIAHTIRVQEVRELTRGTRGLLEAAAHWYLEAAVDAAARVTMRGAEPLPWTPPPGVTRFEPGVKPSARNDRWPFPGSTA